MFDWMTAGQVVRIVFDHTWTRAALLLILADVISGIALALFQREFRLARVGEFLFTRAIPYLLGAGTVELVTFAAPPGAWLGLERGAVAGGAWLFACLSLVGHVVGNLRQMGMPIPASLGEDTRIKKAAIVPVLIGALVAAPACAPSTPAPRSTAGQAAA